MQSLKLKKSLLKSTIQIPASKSYANRALIIAATLSDSPEILNLPQSTDVSNLIAALEKLGLKSDRKNGIRFLNTFPECETSDLKLAVGDGGTTARFLAAMLLLGKKTYQLELGGRLKDRPWSEFCEIAKELGASASLEGSLLTIKGPAKFPKQLQIDCSRTTQFATAFSLLTPVTGTQIAPFNLHSSQSYWKMTEKIVSDMKNLPAYHVPLDWSSASYPLAFAALNQEIRFPGLIPDSYQADSKMFLLLKDLGCIREESSAIVVSKSLSSRNVEMDVSDCLDLVPTLGFLLSHVPGKHSLKGIENLVHKESDRLSEIIRLLSLFKREAIVENGVLLITGSEERVPQSITLDMPDDHRMVMAGTLFLLHHNGGSIRPSEAVKKSYPDFFSIISSIET